MKALQMNLRETDKESNSLQIVLTKLLELMGRYIDPKTYLKILLPRVIGDVASATSFSDGGTHSESSCVANAIALSSMMKGTLPKVLLPHSFTLIPALSSEDSNFICKGTKMEIESLKALNIFIDRIKDESIAGAQTSCFQSTGRLHSSNEILSKCKVSMQYIIANSSKEKEICTLASSVMAKISALEK